MVVKKYSKKRLYRKIMKNYAIGFLTTIIFLNFLFGFIVICITGG
jgi:hypothetical protein